MDLFNLFFLLAIILLIPRLAYWGCARVRALGFLGSSLLCFASGIALSFVLPSTASASAISDWCVCLAIPFMLFSLDFRSLRNLAKPAILSFLLICLCVIAACVAGHFLFAPQLGADSAAVNSTLAGLFVGGLVNMAAVGSGLGLSGRYADAAQHLLYCRRQRLSGDRGPGSAAHRPPVFAQISVRQPTGKYN